jgi:hypothetical protein
MRGRALVAVVVVAVVVVTVVIVVERTGPGRGDSGPGSPASASGGTGALLVSGAASATVSSLVIPMGHLGDPANTFWQLFLRPVGSASWSLRTPPGVADNGGLVAALPPTGPLTTGFLPSADLTFSPIAQSTDGGGSWSPTALPTALVGVPDALTASASGRVLALVREAGQTVLSSPAGLSTWNRLVSTGIVAREDPTCRVSAISAVAFGADGQPLLGLACAAAGHIGMVATSVPSSTGDAPEWHDVGPALTTGRAGTATVARLQSTPGGAAGLAVVRSSSASSLVAFWSMGSIDRWVESRPTTVPAGWTLESTMVDDGQRGVTVLLASGSRRQIEEVAGGGSAWTTLPSPPAGTDAVATVGTETDAFVPSGSRLAVWAWSPTSSAWRRTALITVPIQYGSSS